MSVLQSRTTTNALATNKVLRSTYQLLSLTLLFSGLMAFVSMYLQLPHFGWFTLIGYFALLFLTAKLKNSAWGLLSVFALTGFMGLTLGPVINAYLTHFANGAELVMLAMTGTGVIFLTLSFYARVSQKDFSFLSGFLTAGILVAFIAAIANIFLAIPVLSLVVSSAFIILMCGLILFETSNIIHGGETNYIMATITLYVSIYNLFLSLLHLLGVFGGEE